MTWQTIKDKPHIPSYYFLCIVVLSVFLFLLLCIGQLLCKLLNFLVTEYISVCSVSYFVFLMNGSECDSLLLETQYSAVRDQHLLSNNLKPNLKLAAFTVYFTVFLK